MGDDWRLRVDLHEGAQAERLTEVLRASEVERDLRGSLQHRVAVSRDGAEVFCYTGSRAQAEGVEQIVWRLAAEHGWRPQLELKYWHHASEQWEDPGTPEDPAAEHASLMEQEREEAGRRGYPEFEVRVDCGSRAQASQLAERLRDEGIDSVTRSQYLLIGAADEDEAHGLADRLNQELPSDTSTKVEGTLRAVTAEMPGNPFAIFGGLAG